ncbi:MAG TPA: histidinol-phosphatase HisJ family protein [Halanaerobiaceae bacterium]|jgi:histidinol-phosphatase (PHP family)|nr:histidinol-phosphatase HisJ family protein [Bacillota bacterium]HHU92798.1 histidinol-phosphatase HisJ family protein [Halanaerobiaceae bacterium]
MYLVDYHTHPYVHGDIIDYNEKHLVKFIDTAIKKGIREIGFTDHDEFSDEIDWQLMNIIKNSSPIPVKIGLEFDYIPGREEEIKSKIEDFKLDYAIGSVHFIDGWGFDNPSNLRDYKDKDIDQLYIRYYEILKELIKSNLFNIIGHFDLIKVFGYRPKNIDLLSIIRPILLEIKRTELVMEINTNGLNKPVQEIYPAKFILEEAYQLKIPITFASDAHSPERVGENIGLYAEYVKSIGYKEVATFAGREMKMKRI